MQVAAGVALATGRLPRLSSHRPGRDAGAHHGRRVTGSGRRRSRQQKATQRIQFFKNASMLGGLLLAAVDTEGKPGVAWRARRAASDVRREAKRLAKDARHQGRLREGAADLRSRLLLERSVKRVGGCGFRRPEAR